jgi:leucyl-tRNA synthetase
MPLRQVLFPSPLLPRGLPKGMHSVANEVKVQELWTKRGVLELDTSASENSPKEKFFVAFPYPYSNGLSHLGHTFSLTKADLRAHLECHRSKHILQASL